jgi:hypothetical protein
MMTARTARAVGSLMVAGIALVSAGCSGGGTTLNASAGDSSHAQEETSAVDVNRERILADIAESGEGTFELIEVDDLFVVRRGGRPDVMPVLGAAGEIVGYAIATDLRTPDPVSSYNNCVAAAGADAPPCQATLALANEPGSSRVWLGDKTVRALPLFPIDGDPSDPTGYMTAIGAVPVETSRNPEALAAIASCEHEISAQSGTEAINRACAPAQAHRI